MEAKNISRKHLAILFFSIILSIPLCGCTSLKTPEINGVVVDAETGKPIDGARIYVKWQKTVSGPGGQTAGGIAKEFRSETEVNGRFVIPAYALRNYVPYPFGQGGTFYMVAYAHGYMYRRFTLSSESSFVHAGILKEYVSPNGVTLKLASISSPKDWSDNLGGIPEKYDLIDNSGNRIPIKNDFVNDEYKLLLSKFGMKRWDRLNQAQLVNAYVQMKDYKSAIRKIEEIIQDYPEAREPYAEKLEKYRNKIRETEKK